MIYNISHMKRILLIITFILSQSSFAGIREYLSIPADRIQDQLDIISWDQEFRINNFLDKLYKEEGVSLYITLVPSLTGEDLDQAAERALERFKVSSDEKSALFFLSLSDRQFKIHITPPLQQQIPPQEVERLVHSIIPSLASAHVPEAVNIFLKNMVYKVAPSTTLTPPRPSTKKLKNLKGLYLFLGAAFFIFLLGHKIFSGEKFITKDISLERGRRVKSWGVFW